MMNVGWCLMESRVICMFKDKIGVECMEEEEMGSVERKKELVGGLRSSFPGSLSSGLCC